MIKKTFKELREIDSVVATLYAKNPTLRDSKFGYAYQRFYKKNYVPTAQQFNEALSGLQVDYALEEPTTKEVLVDKENNRGFKYAKDQLKILIGKEVELTEEWGQKEYDVEPFISPLMPDNISEYEFDVLKGSLL